MIARGWTLAALLMLAACGGSDAKSANATGGIRDVVVVLTGSDEPLPFDPRGGRLTVVTQEITRLLGHPIVLELDVSLSPELKASLEETVLASFETLARELVLLQKEDPAMFAEARKIERVVCKYDAVAKESRGVIEDGGRRLAVRAPPDRFPLLERWVVSEAVYTTHVADLEARWGDADPTRLPERERAAWFAYMTMTRPGAGYLWIANRRKREGGSKDDDLRVDHVGRIARLGNVVEKGSPLDVKVTDFLLGDAAFLGGFAARSMESRVDPRLLAQVTEVYQSWLTARAAGFGAEQKQKLARALFEHQGVCGRECFPDAIFPRFDWFGFGLAIYDAWVKDGAPKDGPAGPQGLLYRSIVCPQEAHLGGGAETEVEYGCSPFFALTLESVPERARLARVIDTRRDERLLETALLNLPWKGGAQALALVELLHDERLVTRGLSILFHDLARRDDVRAALETMAPRWWHDQPARRGYTLLVIARSHEDLDPYYGDNQWRRFVAEFGGPIGSDVLAAFLAQGARATEMAPKIWVALAKGPARDDLVAKSLTSLLDRDRTQRSSRARPTLLLLRSRYCAEKDEAGFANVRAALDAWAKTYPADAAMVSNARADFTMSRCSKPASDDSTP